MVELDLNDNRLLLENQKVKNTRDFACTRFHRTLVLDDYGGII